MFRGIQMLTEDVMQIWTQSEKVSDCAVGLSGKSRAGGGQLSG